MHTNMYECVCSYKCTYMYVQAYGIMYVCMCACICMCVPHYPFNTIVCMFTTYVQLGLPIIIFLSSVMANFD